jgi:hypothetical protein
VPDVGHMIDMRNLGEALEHNDPDHLAPAKN